MNSAVRELGDELTSLDLIDSGTFIGVCQSLGATDIMPDRIVEELVRSGRLTPFQAEKLRTGSVADIRFDDYVLLDRLGKGGMGEVYKARNIKLGRLEAIKTIIHHEGAAEALSKRFRQEAKVLARLEHPSIVPIYKIGTYEGTDFIAMKYVEGEDLKTRTERMRAEGKPATVATACRWIAEAADALHHAHEHGIIHRDIKPSNLIISNANGRLVVLDMGIARLQDPSGAKGSELTVQRRALGTPEFMPPEQWADATRVTPASDIYALGGTLFYVLAGQVPFPRAELVDLMRAHMNEQVPSLHNFRPDVPEELDQIVQRMLAKQTQDRFASSADVTAALQLFVHEPAAGQQTPRTLGGDTRKDSGRTTKIVRNPDAPPIPTPKPAWKAAAAADLPKQRSRLPVLLAVPLLAVLVGGGWYWWQQSQPSPAEPKEVVATPKTETAEVPAVDWQARYEKLLAEHQRQHATVWPTLAELRTAADQLGPAPTTEAAFAAWQQRLVGLTRQRGLQWLREYQQANAGEWPNLARLEEFAQALVPGKALADQRQLVAANGALEQETARRRRLRLVAAAEKWAVEFAKLHAAAWPDPALLQTRLQKEIAAKPLESEVDLAKLQQEVEADTEALRDPFGNLRRGVFPQADAERALLTMQDLLAVQALPPDPKWKISGTFVDTNDKPIQSAKVRQQVFLKFGLSKESYVTPVQFNEQSFVAIFMNKRWPSTDEILISSPFTFTDPGAKHLILYATDRPIITEMVTLSNGDDAAQRGLKDLFARPVVFDRLRDSFLTGRSFPTIEPSKAVAKWARAVVQIEIVP